MSDDHGYWHELMNRKLVGCTGKNKSNLGGPASRQVAASYPQHKQLCLFFAKKN